MKKIYFAVNNELNYDQRMIRICGSLAANNHTVILVGKRYRDSKALSPQNFGQHRLRCFFKTGKFAYLEFNIRLLCYLAFQQADGICAIDLDTIFPVLIVTTFKKCRRIYDAHELFTEMKEVVSRAGIKKIWTWVEKNTVPKFAIGYTVSESIAEFFHRKYGVTYSIIRNMPRLKITHPQAPDAEKFILYQGAVNEGRCLEYLIPAMAGVNARLFICGDGNFMEQARQLVARHQLTDKVIFKGMLLPGELIPMTLSAYIGINLVEPEGLNQLYSLANKFFDYIHAALPQLTMDFVEYARINDEHKVALLIPEPKPALIAEALNLLLENDVLYEELKENCIKAREIYNWQSEEKTLLDLYKKIFDNG